MRDKIIAIRELVAHEAVKAKEASEAAMASRADRSDMPSTSSGVVQSTDASAPKCGKKP